jgi:pimeloyl-ACP methyl ester carboxylesterase
VRQAVERITAPVYLASSADDPFEGGANVRRWSEGLPGVTTRLVPGAAHAMAIYFDVRDELLDFLRRSLSVA